VVLFDDIGAPVHPWQGVSRHPLARGGLRHVGHLEAPRAGHRMRTLGEVVLIAGGSTQEPCSPNLEVLPPEIWDSARPGPESAFELISPLDPRFPRALPYRGIGIEYLVHQGHEPCPPASTRGAPEGPCWIFPRNARIPSDGRIPWDGPLPLEGRLLWGESHPDERLLPEPRDRVTPFSGSSKDPRPAGRPPGYPELKPTGKKTSQP
jgi:hypothetical protein